MGSAPTQMKLRIPADLRAFIEAEAKRHASSLNSEVIRCIRYRMDNRLNVGTETAHVTRPQKGRSWDG